MEWININIADNTTGISDGLYYSFYQTWFIVLGDIILLMTSILSIYKNDIKVKKKKQKY